MTLFPLGRIVPVAITVAALTAPGSMTPAAQAPPPPRYTIEDLSIAGAGDSFADAIDSEGTVVGFTRTSAGRERAFRFNGVSSVHLDTIGGTLGGQNSQALGVGFREVTGWSNLPGGTAMRGFVFDQAGTRDIGTLGGASTLPRDIESGTVTGASSLANGAQHAFLMTPGGVLRDLGTLGGRNSYGSAVRFPGAVGWSEVAPGSGDRHAFLFDASSSTMRDLGTLGGRSSEARDISIEGHITGSASTAAHETHAFVHDGTAMADLGTLGGTESRGFAINDAGHVVGDSTTPSGARHAFLYANGQMVDLNSMIDPASGWVLVSARGVNNSGQIAGYGTFQGTTRAFRLSPPVDIELQNSGRDETGNFPNPRQTGRDVNFVLGVQVVAVENVASPADVTVVDSVFGAVDIVSVTTYGGDPSACSVSGKVVTCTLHLFEGGLEEVIFIRVRPTAPGVFGHSARASSRVFDPNLANNSLSEQNTAVSLSTVALTPSTIAGGKTASLRVRLTSGAPSSGSVRLTSSNPAVAPIRSSLILHTGETTRATNIVPKVVAEPTTVNFTATFGLVSRTTTLTILPPALSAFYLSPSTVIGGCETTVAKVALTGAAPDAGAAVTLAESIPAAQFPAAIVVPGAAMSGTMRVPTNFVTAPQVGTVTASYGGGTKAITLTVRPIRARSITVTPNPVVGGNPVTGTVTLECPSPTPVTVSLSSGSSSASPTVPSITIPAGASSGTFSIRTAAVSAAKTVALYARVYNVRRSTSLTLTP
jgi:probable HAF family extracellular repeat protein